MIKQLKNSQNSRIRRNGPCLLKAKGISLVEVLISTFLLSLVLISLTKIYYYAEYQINIARHKAMAINLIQANFESLLSTGYPGINAGDYPITTNVTIDPGNLDAASDDLAGTMVTQLVNLNVNQGYKFISTVTWNEAYGGPGRTLTENAELLMTNYE
jgi:hypothetical protein